MTLHECRSNYTRSLQVSKGDRSSCGSLVWFPRVVAKTTWRRSEWSSTCHLRRFRRRALPLEERRVAGSLRWGLVAAVGGVRWKRSLSLFFSLSPFSLFSFFFSIFPYFSLFLFSLFPFPLSSLSPLFSLSPFFSLFIFLTFPYFSIFPFSLFFLFSLFPYFSLFLYLPLNPLFP